MRTKIECDSAKIFVKKKFSGVERFREKEWNALESKVIWHILKFADVGKRSNNQQDQEGLKIKS